MGRYINTSLCMSQDHHNHLLINHDKFEDLFTTITKISRFFPQWYKCMKTSDVRKCTKPLAQRYKAKQVLRQNSTMLIKLFDFLIFMWFLDFWHKRRKRLIKNKNEQKYAQIDKQSKSCYTKSQQSSVCPNTNKLIIL